jgi:hypothetical protein
MREAVYRSGSSETYIMESFTAAFFQHSQSVAPWEDEDDFVGSSTD